MGLLAKRGELFTPQKNYLAQTMIELNLLERHGFTVKAHCRYPYWEISAKGQKWLIGREDGELVSTTPWLKEALVAIREHYAPILQHPVYRRNGTPGIREQCWLLIESTEGLEQAIAYLNILGSKEYMDRCESCTLAAFRVEPPAGGFKKAKKLTDQIVEILLANPRGLVLEQIQLALIDTEWATEESTVRETLRRLEAKKRITRSWAKLPGQRRDRRLFFAVQSQQVASLQTSYLELVKNAGTPTPEALAEYANSDPRKRQ